MSGPWDDYESNGPWTAYAGKPSVVEIIGTNLRYIPRAVGLAGRYALEGVTGLGEVVGNAMDAGLNAVGAEGQTFGGNAGTTLSDMIGLPAPRDPTERVVGDASRILTGAMSIGGAASKAADVTSGAARQVLTRLGANLPQQAASAVGAGVAGGSVREAGGGPIEQFAAALLGGVAGGVGYSKGADVSGKAKAALDAWMRPKDIAGRLEFELQRAGVDWQALSNEARAQLVKDAQAAIYRKQPLSPDALRRLADFRNVGATPLTGDITQDPRLITQQRNLAKVQANAPKFGGPDLADIQNSNAKRVLSALDDVETSPADAFQTGAGVQGAMQAKDAAAKAAESALYATARDSAGRAVPLDRTGFVNEAIDNLIKSNKTNFLPGEIRSLLNQISRGTANVNGKAFDVPFDVNTIDQLKTTLASASRASKDGNVRAAISAVRSALENVKPEPIRPQFGGQQVATAGNVAAMDAAEAVPAETLKAFDAARMAARNRRTWQESAPFIEDALEGMDPQAFVKKHITGAGYPELLKLRTEIGGNKELSGAVRKQLVGYILERGRADSDVTRFSSAGMEQAFKSLGEQKLKLWFSPQEMSQIRSAINVGKYMQAQPIGSAVNNSNSGAMVIARMLGELLKGTPVIGPMVAQPAANAITGVRATIQAQQSGNVGNALMAAQPQQPRIPAATLLAAPALPRRKDKRRD